jgi:hypothetical protein
MRLEPNPARPTQRCKIKAVNPPFRSVSTLRCTKDLPVGGPVNPATALGPAQQPASASEWSAERLSERLRIEFAPGAWKRLVHAAEGRGTSVKQLLRSAQLAGEAAPGATCYWNAANHVITQGGTYCEAIC